MSATTLEFRVTNLSNKVGRESLSQKTEPKTFEEIANDFLDKVNEVRNYLDSKTTFIEDLNKSFEDLTWYSDKDASDDDLYKLNELIAKARDLRKAMLKNYAFDNKSLRNLKVCNDSLNNLKDSIDELKDVVDTVEYLFFFQSKDSELNNLLKEVSNL